MVREEQSQRTSEQVGNNVSDLKLLVRQQTLNDFASNAAHEKAGDAGENQRGVAPEIAGTGWFFDVPNHVKHGCSEEEADKVKNLVVDSDPCLSARMEAEDAEDDEVEDV